ncbi:MAG: ROK family protein [Lewinellaceae bacterium]|jgi:predicted NBD/HSP70 family sugar kinase|nr:ROK family protein [Lewinellaceae bacterium]
MHYWGIDLGGTKIEGAVLQHREKPTVLARQRVATEADHGYDHILNQISKLVDQLKKETGLQPAQIGIGHPGALDPQTGVIKNSNTQALIDKPFDRDLAQKLGVPVRLANDANCFAVAEALMGAVPEKLPDAEVVFGVILGTGVGGGLVVRGKVIHGRQGIAGEWGHNFLDESGGPCYCGRSGCVETVFSGPALERFYTSMTGRHVRLPEVVRLAEAGTDPAATATLDRLVQYFGKAIAVVINIVDPDAIVLGGGVGNIDRLYTDGVAEARKYLFNTRIDTVFLKPRLGDSAGVFGAALL